ncbi:MAG: hypothetical protein V2A74_14670, partial [bacterium]
MRTRTRTLSLLLSIFAWSALCVAASAQGSLTPPGAPAPTMRTLDEVDPGIPIHASDLPLAITTPGR